MQLKFSPIAIADVQRRMQEANVPVQDQPLVMTISVARLIAFQLPLPGDIADPYIEFNSRYYAEVEAAAGSINEHIIVHIADVVELTRRIWVFRWRLAYNANHGSISQLMDALIRCGSPEITTRTAEDFIRYSDHVTSADQVFRPLVVSMSRRD